MTCPTSYIKMRKCFTETTQLVYVNEVASLYLKGEQLKAKGPVRKRKDAI